MGSRVVTFQWWEWWPYIINSPNFGRNFEVNDDDWIWFILIYLKCSCRSRKVVKKVVHLTIGWGYTAANLPHFQVIKSRILRMSMSNSHVLYPFPSHSYQASGIIHGCGWSLARGLPMLCTASTTRCRSFPKKKCDARAGDLDARWPFWGGKVPNSFWTWEEKDYKGLCLFRSFWLSFYCSCISFDCFLPPFLTFYILFYFHCCPIARSGCSCALLLAAVVAKGVAYLEVRRSKIYCRWRLLNFDPRGPSISIRSEFKVSLWNYVKSRRPHLIHIPFTSAAWGGSGKVSPNGPQGLCPRHRAKSQIPKDVLWGNMPEISDDFCPGSWMFMGWKDSNPSWDSAPRGDCSANELCALS
jgi:hypothetical protein